MVVTRDKQHLATVLVFSNTRQQHLLTTAIVTNDMKTLANSLPTVIVIIAKVFTSNTFISSITRLRLLDTVVISNSYEIISNAYLNVTIINKRWIRLTDLAPGLILADNKFHLMAAIQHTCCEIDLSSPSVAHVVTAE